MQRTHGVRTSGAVLKQTFPDVDVYLAFGDDVHATVVEYSRRSTRLGTTSMAH